MSLTTASITNFMLSGLVDPQILNPLINEITIANPYTFAGITGLKTRSGAYTPANDQIDIETHFTITSVAEAPNFVFLFVDRQMNVNIANFGGNFQLNEVCVQNILVYTAPYTLTNYINTINLYGKTASANPMAQGIAVNYTIIYGRATITP